MFKEMFKELISVTIAVAVSFFILSGAGIFTMWFWLMIFT
jgi:hypothetical protein